MIWRDALTDATHVLDTAGVEDARVNAEYLAAHALGLKSKSKIRSFLGNEIPKSIQLKFDELISRRAKREPLQYILGEWEFFGLPIKVTPAALIPRPETEILVEETLKEAANIVGRISILDIGTGSGAIALAIASRLPHAKIVGIDSSDTAIELAIENQKFLKLKDVRFLHTNKRWTNWSEWIENGPFDFVVSNPPYVSLEEFEEMEPELRLYEPREALTDESSGLTFYDRIASLCHKILTKNGRLIVELGFGDSEEVAGIFRSQALEVLRLVDDLAGIPRVLIARMH